MRFLRGTLCVALALAAGVALHAAGDDLKDLRRQLDAASLGNDEASVAEISRRILEQAPRDATAWEKLALARLRLADYDLCEQALGQWEKEEKKTTPLINDLRGDLAMAQNHGEDAIRHWTDSVKQKPDADIYEKIAKARRAMKQWDLAIEAATKLISMENTAASRAWRAGCYLEIRRWDDAIADIKKANQMDPQSSEVKDWLPQIEMLQRALPKIHALDKAIAAGKPQPSLLLDRGMIFQGVQRYELALEDANAALAIDPNSRRAVLQKAQALMSLGRKEETAKLRVITNRTNFPEAALLKIGAFDTKIAEHPGDAAFYTGRARECSDVEQYGLAQEDAFKATELDPQSSDALVEEGFATMKLGNLTAAMKEFKTAAELNPKNFIAWRSMGELEMDRANYPAAIGYFTRSLELHESPLVLQKREKCYRYSGHTAEADRDREHWEKLSPPKPAKK